MIPTSLGVVGFAPAQGTLSSQVSSFSSSSSQWTSDADQQGTSFLQVMSSYTRSNQDGSADENNSSNASQAQNEQTNRSQDEAQASDAAAAAAADQQQANVPAASSFTGSFGLRKSGEEDQAAGEREEADAATAGNENTQGTTPQSGLATQFRGLSAMQLLLNGGSLAQVLGAGNNTQPTTGQMAAKGDGADANAAAGANAAQPVTSKLPLAGLNGTAKTKTEKAQPESAKRTSDASAAAPDLSLLATNTLLPTAAANEAATGNGDAANTSKSGMAIAGASAEALHLSAAGQSDHPANTTANNFAFAVRLTNENAAAQQHTESNASAESPLGLTTAASTAVLAAGAEAAALSGGGAQTGEHAGEAPDQGALMFASETAPAGQAAHTNPTAAAEDATPAAASEPETETPTDPVRNVRLQLAGDNNQRVDIRLVDVGGEMRVSVRAGDTKLAQTLQDHLPDLSKSLNQQSVRAEVWSPRTENASQTGGANGGQSSRGGDSPGQGSEQQQQRQGSGRQQQNQPDWVDELENYSSRTTTTRSNQVWPQ